MDAAEALQQLDSSAAQGLSAAEAERRLAAQGANELQAASPISRWAILAEQFKNVLIIILLVAVVLSAFLGHTLEALAIAVIVIFAALLGFFQEYRAERALEALRHLAAPTATVLREGKELAVPARELVVGDVIFLRMGDKVPADGRLIEAANLQVDEAALTGESLPVEKQTARKAGADLAVADRNNIVYAGTAVTYGLRAAEERGILFIAAGTPVYAGMVVGEQPRDADMEVNVCKAKKLTSMRENTKGEIEQRLSPPRIMSLDEAIEYLGDDELLEVTPQNLRIRKRILDMNQRYRAAKKKEEALEG